MTASLILVLNSGSSSLKSSVFDLQQNQEVFTALAERLLTPQAQLTWRTPESGKQTLDIAGADHTAAFGQLIAAMTNAGLNTNQLHAVGHRVVHGGEAFSASVRINDTIMNTIEQLAHLAPLHNPANAEGIRAVQRLFPDLPQVAVFDTAFHQSLPPAAYTYALPYAYYKDHGVRRYGFHGTSHRYVSAEAVARLDLDPESHRLITAHLGNGCSACAVKNGQSLDTTMGMTPLEGLVMGTRCGDIDPSLHDFLAQRTGLSLGEITHVLNKESGLLGISGLSNDMRTLMEAAESTSAEITEPQRARAQLAIDVFCYRLAKAIASLTVATGGLDALVFTGGIGENAANIRTQVVHHLSWLGLNLDVTANLSHGRDQMGLVSTTREPAVMVIPTREEWLIAQDTQRLVQASWDH
ncbi:acetate/propionate family kinase [Salinispirillum marinum]|uniref:Acetate kinase n=2 Tax=Saccharospirillaceae TaxID=255527 RepID=A0ABV8BJ92_9GAMM